MKLLNLPPIQKQTRVQEQTIENEILKIQQNISETSDHEKIETSKNKYTRKKDALEKITEKMIQGLILRSKAHTVEHGEKNSKSFANLEKKRLEEAKIISRLKINNITSTNHNDILSQIERFYKNLYNKREVGHSAFNFFDDSIRKLSNLDKNSCEGLITEVKFKSALKNMNNQKSPGSDGITVEFYKLFGMM